MKKCPGCARRIKLYRMFSTDTTMAKFWTDGRMEAPLIPDQPEFVKCPFCGVLFWVEKAEILAEEKQKPFASDRWKNARFVLFDTQSVGNEFGGSVVCGTNDDIGLPHDLPHFF